MCATRLRIHFLIAATLLLVGGRPAGATPVISTGSSIDLGGGVFVVPIEITGAVELTAWQFDLSFNPSAVQIDVGCTPDTYCDLFNGPVTEGPFFTSLALFPTLFVPGFIDNFLGQLVGAAGFWQDPPPGPSGDGILAYIQFITVSPDVSPNITVENPSTQSSVPEPATLALFTTGLGLLGARRRRLPRGRR
jgi:PEP-CTERM motif